jgi:hypothetical protein
VALFLRLILLLFASVGCVLLVLLLLALVVALLNYFICNGTELGVQLELALERVEQSSCHAGIWLPGFSSS